MANLLISVQQVAILFVMMGVGFALRRLGLLRAKVIDGLVDLLLLVVTPCQIVEAFIRPYDTLAMQGLEWALVLSVASYLIMIGVACLVVRLHDHNRRGPLRMAVVFSNAGTLAIPLVNALFGNEGVFYAAVYMAVQNFFIWTWGYWMMKNDGTRMCWTESLQILNFRSLVNPGTIGIVLGLPVFMLSLRLPAVIGEPIRQIANLNTPLGMIVIGSCLKMPSVSSMLRMPESLVVAFFRLVGCPVLMILLLCPFWHRFDRCMALSLVTAASAPVAATVSMFATKFNHNVGLSAALVSGTTLVSTLTMPLLIGLAWLLFK